MTVSDIFQTETPKLIGLFFEKFEEPTVEEENSGYASQEEETEEKASEEVTETPGEQEKEKDDIQEGKQLLHYLFQYLYCETEYASLNQTLAGYFAKTVGAILNVKGAEVLVLNQLLEFVFTEKMDCFAHFVKKIGCKSLAELFSKFLSIYNPDKDEYKNDYIEQRKEIMDLLVKYYDACDDFEVEI